MYRGWCEASWDHTAHLLLQQAAIHSGRKGKRFKLHQFHPYRAKPKAAWSELPKADIRVLKQVFVDGRRPG